MGYLGPAFAAVLITYAAIVLWNMAQKVSPGAVANAIEAVPMWRVALAFALTAVSVTALAAYDVCAVLTIRTRKPIDLRYAALVGGISNVFANGLGFPLVTGGAARYRLYSMQGHDFSVVGRIFVLTWVTMWSGLVFLLGVALAFQPVGEPAVFFSQTADRVAGVTLVVLLFTTILWVGRKRRAVRLGGWTVRLPSTPVLFGMVAAGGIDLFASAATLYVLLPPDVTPSLAIYVLTFIAAVLFGNAASTPGGLGVFEATLVTGLGIDERPDVAAALILFRLIYFVVPLAFALAAMAVVEWRHRRGLRRAGLAGTDGKTDA
ncbi:putative bifunctional lysylphosphatidylglycerol flippase/synthetase [Methylobrevis albus]|uniref:UPF0104 family protein n=1 Tax=Methylobrevis albus TaxID=2793297 RepID=A0A931MWC7_9HYPH|nr:lysylphosphatidylglycerol synthase domain-containing protein [Methylobrevis albus]MBH0236633.1 UPF0104 family protein [Methylobrevis albus]